VPKSLAVHIENHLQDPSLEWIGSTLDDALVAGLENAKGIRVISAARIRQLMERRAPADAAREAHADLFLSGALRRNGTRVRLDFRTQETATGHTLFADQVEGPDPQAILKMADQAFAIIVARLVPDEVSSIPSIAAGLTTNLEALKAYEEGRTQRIAFRPGAFSSLERAIELDPHFVLAH
jgi:TolB-like protein